MTISSSRVMSSALRSRVMSADDAAALVPNGANVGMSGFTGSGYPKAVPMALARRIEQAQARGEQFRIGVWNGASTATRTGWRAGQGQRHRVTPALPVRSGHARAHQCRRDGISRHSPQPCRAVRRQSDVRRHLRHSGPGNRSQGKPRDQKDRKQPTKCKTAFHGPRFSHSAATKTHRFYPTGVPFARH